MINKLARPRVNARQSEKEIVGVLRAADPFDASLKFGAIVTGLTANGFQLYRALRENGEREPEFYGLSLSRLLRSDLEADILDVLALAAGHRAALGNYVLLRAGDNPALSSSFFKNWIDSSQFLKEPRS
jgi:hypothetical protein